MKLQSWLHLCIALLEIIIVFLPAKCMGFRSNSEINVNWQIPSFIQAGDTAIVEITFNVGEGIASPIRGLYFADAIPDDMFIEKQSYTVTINGTVVINIAEEIGTVGEIYPSAVPYRLLLEKPPHFLENNPLYGGDELILTYQVTAPVNITTMTQYTFPGFNWVGYICCNAADSVFGYSDFPLFTLTVLPDLDIDDDGIFNDVDNCPGAFNPNQEDTYPPQGNGIGDACVCEGNFSCSEDQDVDGSDAATFKAHFGRSQFKRPCIAEDTCNGDFSCDGDVDGSDAALFKSDFGRSLFQNPCPACNAGGDWCNYE